VKLCPIDGVDFITYSLNRNRWIENYAGNGFVCGRYNLQTSAEWGSFS